MKKVYIERNKLFKNIPMVLCNNISTVDENFIEDNYQLYEYECEDCEGTGEKDGKTCEDCAGDGKHDSEVYQMFIISANEWDIERLKEYGVEVGYSNALDVHVLPIYDYGTSWSMFSYSKEVENNYGLAQDETLERSTVY